MNILSANGQSVWRVQNGQTSTKIIDGWWQMPRAKPYFLDSVAGVIRQGSECGVWLFGKGEAVALGDKTEHDLEILAYNEDILVTASYDFMNDHSVVYVYSMVKEIVE
jgi:hypothetical protein